MKRSVRVEALCDSSASATWRSTRGARRRPASSPTPAAKWRPDPDPEDGRVPEAGDASGQMPGGLLSS